MAPLRKTLKSIAGWLLTKRNLRRNAGSSRRRLEIGPGPERLPGFESLNIVPGRAVDYVLDATKPLPFPDATFDLIYASHIIEHVAWYQVGVVLREWVRILKPGGHLEIWTPDGLKIVKAYVAAEEHGSTEFHEDNWWRYNERKDPCLWANGRIFTYGDGTGDPHHPNWHRSLFSERHLRSLMHEAGLTALRRMDRSEVRGHDHGWINLGISGTKPG
jgi:SAM-dependent methyltransferase